MAIRLLSLIAALAIVATACNDDTVTGVLDGAPPVDDGAATEEYRVEDQPAGAAAMFVSPAAGDTVNSPVQISLGAEGVGIVPAGAPAVGEGHFHIMLDVECLATGETFPGPSDEATADGYRHFGTGVSEVELELEPGTYTLCVQLGDGVHTAFGATDTITITVE